MLVPENHECANYPEPLPIAHLPTWPHDSINHVQQPMLFSATHVTLEALENTKVAVAQFAATALANGADAASLKDLARLQSSLNTLQHQQMFQINLIHELQSKVADNEEAQQRATEGQVAGNSVIVEELVCDETIKEMPLDSLHDDNCNTDEAASDKPLSPPSPLSHNLIYQPQPSPESSVITHHHDPATPFDQHNVPNSLEMLRRGAQEALDTASQGLLSGNLVDELTRRRDQSSDEFKSEMQLKHRCRYCGKVFGSDSALQIHLRSHTGERPFSCHICGTRFTTKGNLKVHFQRHLDERPYGSGIAGDWEMGRPDGEHGSTGEPGCGTEDHLAIDQSRQCPICFMKLPCQKTLQVHILSHQTISHLGIAESHRGNPETSTKSETRSRREEKPRDSPRTAPKQETQETPLRSQFRGSPKTEADSNIFAPLDLTSESKPMELSNPPLISPSELPVHSMFQHSFRSDQPGPFDQQSTLNLMNNMRGGTTCNVCYKTFACYSALEIHYRSHTKERPFKCKVCDRSFSTKVNYKPLTIKIFFLTL